MLSEVSTQWLKSISNPVWRATTTNINNEQQAVNEVVDSIEAHGMRDPLLIVANLDGALRLESGNNRVDEFLSRGYEYLPCVLMVLPRGQSLLRLENGAHVYRAKEYGVDVSGLLEQPYPYIANLTEIVTDPSIIFG
ncbi:ParB N-terminal domain-containing protein [Vibrio breoganii]